MESSPAVAGNTIQYTAMDYCKGRAEKWRISHTLLPRDLQLALLLPLSLAKHQRMLYLVALTVEGSLLQRGSQSHYTIGPL